MTSRMVSVTVVTLLVSAVMLCGAQDLHESSLQIFDCPSNITKYIYQNEGANVFWNEPTATGAIGPPIISPQGTVPGDFIAIYDAPATVSYTFTSELQETAVCSFTIFIEQASCDPNQEEFQCVSNGRCIPDQLACNYYSDCGDGSDELECGNQDPACISTAMFASKIQEDCYDFSELNPAFNTAPADVWNFSVPLNHDSYFVSILFDYTTMVQTEPSPIPPPGQGGTPAFLTEFTTSSGQDVSFITELNLNQNEGGIEGGTGGAFPLGPNEIINITVKYTTDILNEPFQLVQYDSSRCSQCIKIRVVYNKYPMCQGVNYLQCIRWYYLFNMIEAANPQCNYPEENSQAFRHSYQPCLDSTSVNVQGGLTVLGCPDNIIATGAQAGDQLPIVWAEPIAFDLNGNLAGAEGFPFPGQSFEVGQTVWAEYAFFGLNQQAGCQFNITVNPASCGDEFFTCDNGECIPSEYLCDLFQDCSDGSDQNAFVNDDPESCEITGDQCNEVSSALTSLMSNCLGFDYADIQYNPSNLPAPNLPWNFTHYGFNPLQSAYLIGISLQPQSISNTYGFVQPNNPSGRFTITLQTTLSGYTKQLSYVWSGGQGEGQGEGSGGQGDDQGQSQAKIRVELRVPLQLQHRDQILLNVTYTPDFLNDAPEYHINPNVDCPACVQAIVASSGDSNCGGYVSYDSNCLTAYYLWDKAVKERPQCEIEERAMVLQSLPVSQCLDTIKIDQVNTVLILGCPDDINLLVPRYGGPVHWTPPTFINATDSNYLVEPHSSNDPGDLFQPGGPHIVTYFPLSDFQATCTFIVDVFEVECKDNEFSCSNGRCILTENMCDYFDDCGDESDEIFCSRSEMCSDIRQPFNAAFPTACSAGQPSLEYMFDYDEMMGSSDFFEYDYDYIGDEGDNILMYKVPVDQSGLYLTRVSIDAFQFETLGSAFYGVLNRHQYAFRFEVTTSNSKLSATTYKLGEIEQSNLQGAGNGYLRNPLALRRGEEVRIEVFFTADYLNGEFVTFGAASASRYSPLLIKVKAFRDNCAGGLNAGDNNCLRKVVEWKEALEKASDDTVNSCMRSEELELYRNFYTECLSPPFYEFIEPDQYGAPGTFVNLRCVAGGTPLPTVKWIRTRDNVAVTNSSIGSSGVSIEISQGEREKYACEIESFLGKLTPKISVGIYDAVCEGNIMERSDLYNSFTTCSSQIEQNHIFSPDPNQKRFSSFMSFPSRSPPGYWDTIRLSGDSLRNLNIRFPPIQTVDLFIRKVFPQRRRKRAINTTPIYFKRYHHVFFTPAFGDVIFDLDPPVPPQQHTDFEIEIAFVDTTIDLTVSDIGLQGFSNRTSCPSVLPPAIPSEPSEPGFRRKRQGLLLPENCTSLYNDLTVLQTAVSNSDCGIADRQYKVLQLCLQEATAAPKVEMHPRSKSSSLNQNARISCYVENAIRYKWQRMSSDITNPLLDGIESNTLWFKQFSPTDQGAYQCVGFGGGAFSSVEAKSRPAVLTAEGVSTFLVTIRIPEPNYEADQIDARGEAQDPSDWIRTKLMALQSEAGFSDVETRGYKAGSLIVESLVYYDTTGTNSTDTQLAEMVQSFLKDEITNANEGDFVFDLYGLGVIDANSLTVQNIGACPGGVTQEPNGRVLTWPDTPINEMAESLEKCEVYSAQAGEPRATRRCTGDFISAPQWQETVVNNCFEGEDPNDQLDILVEMEVTMENVGTVAEDVAELSNNTEGINGDGLVDISILLEGIAEVGDTSDEVSINFVKTVDNTLDIGEDEFIETVGYNASSRIVRSLEMQITNLQRAGKEFTEIRRNIGVRAIRVPKTSVAVQSGIKFISKVPLNGNSELSEDDTVIVFGTEMSFDKDRVEASIELPSDVFTFKQSISADAIPVSFFIYQNSKLFQSRILMEQSTDEIRRVFGSRIIAATVEGADVQGLNPKSPVVTSFQIKEDVLMNEDEEIIDRTCGFWDFKLNYGEGDWSNEGCVRAPNRGTDRIVCHCDHLTSFAVVVDIHGQSISSLVLDLISKIGCAVSMVALLFTIITYLVVRNLRRAQPQRILISLCIALFGLYTVFLAGIEATGGIGCIIVAILLHYFTLASLMWMGVEAVNMYLLFVRVWDSHIHLFLVKASIVAWGVPAIVVAVAAGMDYKVYDNENHCFMNVGNVFYFGQLLLIGIILLFNSVVFIIVQYKLTCGRTSMSGRDKDKTAETIKRLQNAVIISILLGLTWISAFLMIIQEANFVFQIIFCALNSLQGLFIFLLFCVRQVEVRRAWKRWFCCGGDDYRRSSGPVVSSSAGGTHSTGTGSRGYSSEGNGMQMSSHQFEPAN